MLLHATIFEILIFAPAIEFLLRHEAEKFVLHSVGKNICSRSSSELLSFEVQLLYVV